MAISKITQQGLEGVDATCKNVVVGDGAGAAISTATQSTAVGTSALASNQTGNRNTAIGTCALYTVTTSTDNTAVGANALRSSTTGVSNIAIGSSNAVANTSGGCNTTVGTFAFQVNTSGCANTSLGYQSLCANTTANNNTAVGYQALLANTTGAQNTAIGRLAGTSNTTGTGNSFLGHAAGQYVTTGSNNTIVGRFDGNQGGLDIRTSSNNIVLSDGDGNPRQVISSNGSVGFNGRIPSSGGITLSGLGAEFNNGDGVLYLARSGGTPFFIQRCTNTGEMIAFMNGANTRASIGLSPTGSDNFKVYGCSNYAEFGSCTVGFQAYGGFNHAVPYAPGTCAYRDNALCWGGSSVRWKTIYAVNSTINTSDVNEKQDIEALTEAELRVAAQAKTLVKKFRWKQSVAEKGEDVARIHVGVIAQELQSAFEAEGLDPHRYSLFTKDVWWEAEVEFEQPIRDENNIETSEMETVSRIEHFREEENAPEGAVRKERLGVRYTELLAFIIAAI